MITFEYLDTAFFGMILSDFAQVFFFVGLMSRIDPKVISSGKRADQLTLVALINGKEAMYRRRGENEMISLVY